MNRYLFLMVCTLLSCGISSAQKSTNLKPKWVGNTPKSTSKDFYFVEVFSDAASSLDAARTAVKQNIASNVERTDKVSVTEVFEDHSKQYYSNGNVSFNGQDSYQLNLSVEGSARPITSRRIDEYWETAERGGNNRFVYHALYAIERQGVHADFSGIRATSSYGVHGLWRSAIVPGWGQLYKGSTLKGGLIMGGTAALIGATIYTDCMRADYSRKINKTHSAENKRTYATRRDNFAMGRNICLGTLGALYIYNLIDAIVAPGARRIVVHELSGGQKYALLPTVTDEGAPALSFAMTF